MSAELDGGGLSLASSNRHMTHETSLLNCINVAKSTPTLTHLNNGGIFLGSYSNGMASCLSLSLKNLHLQTPPTKISTFCSFF